MVATSPDDIGARRASPRDARYAALDGLRGLAVLIVVASHLSNAGFLPLPGLAGAGKSGVYLFFALSAFLLTDGLLAKSAPELRRVDTWLDYAFRRVLRIWPLYLVVLLLSWWATAAGIQWWHYRIDAGSLIQHVSMRAGQSVLWSIPVEFKFYAWLPLIALGFWTARRRGLAWPAGLALGVVLVLVLHHVWPPEMAEPNDIRLRPYIAIFLLGSLAAYVHRSLPSSSSSAAARGRTWWGLVGVLALAFFAATIPVFWALLQGRDFDPLVNHRWFAFFGVLWSLVLLSTLHGPRWLASLLGGQIGMVHPGARVFDEAVGIGRYDVARKRQFQRDLATVDIVDPMLNARSFRMTHETWFRSAGVDDNTIGTLRRDRGEGSKLLRRWHYTDYRQVMQHLRESVALAERWYRDQLQQARAKQA